MPDATSRLSAALQGRYTVERLLGEGGMATVYLATDVRHNRRVALKVLKPELAAVVGAARFLAEIETTAKLQHPHILPLFDSGEADGLLFYVMPHVEGESLRDRLDRERQLPVEQAVAIATDVADALEYAHKRGVIHRDIKPANILLQDGKALVSDFGIALALNAGGAGRLTETGLSLGTPHYMSPEQATGDMGVGAATDIYALGCVLYEMLVGEPPYTGSTPQAVLGKIIAGEMPSATKQRASVPANVDATIRKALERVPADRFGTAGELARVLGDGAFRHGPAAGARLAVHYPSGRGVALALGGAVTGAVLMSLLTGREPATPTAGVMRFPLLEGEQVLRRTPLHPDLAISRDGRMVAYKGFVPGTGEQLYLRKTDEVAAIALAGAEDAVSPSFSPDGRWIAFVDGTAQATLKRVAVTGGASETLAELESVGYIAGVTWEDSDHLIVGTGSGTGLFRVTIGGAVESLLRGQYHWPTYVEGRDAVIFMDHADSELHLAALDLRTGEVSPLGVQGTAPRYLPSGHLVYSTPDGRLAAARFDDRTLALVGEPVTLTEVVDLKANNEAAANFDVSSGGTLVFIPAAAGNGQRFRLLRIARDGAGSLVASIDGDVGYPRVSPDGSRVAVAIGSDLWTIDLLRGARTRVTFGGVNRFLPLWTADGSSLTHADGTDAQNRVLLTTADGSGRQDTLIAVGPRAFPTSWSPDGRTLALTVGGQENRPRDIHTLLRGGARSEAVSLVETEFNERGAVFSPNGRWVAYVSDKSGRDEIYVRPLAGPGAEVTVSLDGGREPAWSRSGTELFYRGPSSFTVVSISSGAQGPNVGQPRALFTDTYRRDVSTSAGGYANYDVTPSGELVVVADPEAQGSGTIHIAVNWMSELRERLPN